MFLQQDGVESGCSRPTANSRGQVALFMPTLAGGGAQRVMLNLGQEIVQLGYTVDLLIANAVGPLVTEVPPGVRLINFDRSRVVASLPSLVRYLRASRPIGLLSTIGHANIIALWAKLLSGVPVRVVIREATTPSQALANAQLLRTRLVPILARVFFRGASGIVATSAGMAKDLSEMSGVSVEKIRVIYNPVISSGLFTRAAEPVAHPWFLPGNHPVVLGVGRLTRAKNFPLLMDAFALLREQLPARLVILGEGEERTVLESKAKELGIAADVDMPGFVANPLPYMRQAAVFVLSSDWEGLPNALIEALALGTPVVATDCPSGPREILKNGCLGELVPLNNPPEMFRALEAVLRGKRYPLGDADLDRFRSASVAQEYLDLILGCR